MPGRTGNYDLAIPLGSLGSLLSPQLPSVQGVSTMGRKKMAQEEKTLMDGWIVRIGWYYSQSYWWGKKDESIAPVAAWWGFFLMFSLPFSSQGDVLGQQREKGRRTRQQEYALPKSLDSRKWRQITYHVVVALGLSNFFVSPGKCYLCASRTVPSQTQDP